MPGQLPAPHLASEPRTVVSRLIKQLRLHSARHSQLSLTERAVLKQLRQCEALLPSELAAREKVTTQAMSQILSHLAGLGYLTRQPQATDRRKVLIGPTEAGRAIILNTQQELNDWLHQALQASCFFQELALLEEAVPVLAKVVDFDQASP